MKSILIFFVFFYNSNAIYYDSYHGTPITKDEVKSHEKSKTTSWCTSNIAPCDPDEGRRIDGSCNNLDNPTKGSPHTPFVRVLPADFGKDFNPRKAASGNDLPLARYLRTRLLAEGRVPSQKFTQLILHFLVYMFVDVVSQEDTVNYLLLKTHCCSPEGKSDPACAPNMIPDDDPVHRFSDIHCFNMTKPITFQSVGCIKKRTTPERIVSATPLLDLSILYGSSKKLLSQKFRTFEGGLLKFESVNGKMWPPTLQANESMCFLNVAPAETRCHDTPEGGTNTVISISLFTIWFWRLHNHIATELAKVNPCWDDKKLFNTARDINIASAMQILYYEAMPSLMGKENLQVDKVISSSPAFRDIYNPEVMPQMSLEYPYALRYLHTMQEGCLKMFDTDGAYLKKVPIVNLTLHTGFLEDNMAYVTQGAFRQGAAAIDYIVDPDISELGLGPLQRSADLATSDLSKSRYFGFPPYIKYREFCFGKRVKCWNDLSCAIDPERIEILKNSYESCEDVELLAGIWLERAISGGCVPPTFYCLVADQLLRNVVSDRHWYERRNRPNAFTFHQLIEIRKMTIARLLCDVGDSVSKIQREAFLKIGRMNKLVDCCQIEKIDFSMWKDYTCDEKPCDCDV